jgi:hypothetical protein
MSSNVHSSGSNLPEKREPTHVLRILVPLDLTDPPVDFDVIQDTIKLALGISRGGFAGHICDEPQVDLFAHSGEYPKAWRRAPTDGMVERAAKVLHADFIEDERCDWEWVNAHWPKDAQVWRDRARLALRAALEER